MKRPHHYYQKTYGFDIFFCIGWKPKEFNKYIKKLDHTLNEVGDSIGKTYKTMYKGHRALVIWVKDKKDNATIAHECLHAINFMLDFVGVEASFENDETQAYMLSELITEAAK